MKKGFTLMELLIVVAIIAVLAAISIPVFSSQMTKVKVAKDEANLRSAYAQGVNYMLTGEKTASSKVFKAKVNLSGSYNEIRIFGDLYFAEKSPTYMPEKNVKYKNGEAYLTTKGKKYIIVRVISDGKVGYEALKQDSLHPDSYYDAIYGSSQ